jgi:hypothetical protein
MANEFSIKFPDADLKRFQGLLVRAEKELGKSTKQALQWGVITASKSIGASTKVAPKKRKVIKATPKLLGINTKGMTKTDRAIMKANIAKAPFGVMMYLKGQPVFRQIEKLNVKLSTFRSKTTGEMLARDMRTGKVHKLDNWVNTNREAVKDAGEMVKIRNAGLCKKMWGWLSSNARRSASNSNKADINWSSSGWSVTVRNLLEYAGLAFGGKGMQPVETAMKRASDSIEAKINMALDKQTKAIVA